MENTKLISEAISARQGDAAIYAWISAIRDQKRMFFMILRDRTGMIQVAIDKKACSNELAATLEKVTTESYVKVSGAVVTNEIVKLGGVELQATDLKLLSLAEAPLPIEVTGGSDSSLEVRMDWRFLDLRKPENLFIFRLQTTIEHAMRSFWIDSGFVEIHTPKLMGHPSESGAELFELPYFEKTAYLAQSPQFYKQMAIASGFEKVFEIGPVFRANPSFTSRHDTEFTSVDVEMANIDSHFDIMTFEEKWIQYILKKVKEIHGEEIQSLYGKDVVVPELPFPKITMAEAYKLLDGLGYSVPRAAKGDLDPQGERMICQHLKETKDHEFVFVTDYPSKVRPFYHMRYPNDANLTKSFDLLWRGLEITTGAQREHRYDMLLKQVNDKNMKAEPVQFYLDFFRYGCPPHGGFGFGLTRMLMLLLGLPNVREVTFLYRGPNRLYP